MATWFLMRMSTANDTDVNGFIPLCTHAITSRRTPLGLYLLFFLMVLRFKMEEDGYEDEVHGVANCVVHDRPYASHERTQCDSTAENL